MTGGADSGQTEANATLVTISESDSLWPYTSRSESAADRTLAITLVVRDDPSSVERTLSRLDDEDWRPTNESIEAPNVTVEAGETEVELAWRSAHGATRYTYVERDGTGRWLDEYRQLHAGSYLATRDHVWLYAPADDAGWTALQIHREYWDWFRLRHTVTDVVDSRERAVGDLTDRAYRVGAVRDDTTGTPPITTLEPAAVLVALFAIPLAGRGRRGAWNEPGSTSIDRTGERCRGRNCASPRSFSRPPWWCALEASSASWRSEPPPRNWSRHRCTSCSRSDCHSA